MSTPETDQFGMSPYMVIRDMDANPPHNIHVARRTEHGILSMLATTPNVVADFLEAPEVYYARNLGSFHVFDWSYEVLSPEDIRGMGLPKSMYGHWCPECRAEWPDPLVRCEEKLEEDSFAIVDGQWVLDHHSDNELDSPDHWFLCTECSTVVTEDAAGRDLEELYEDMLNRSVAKSGIELREEARIERGEICPRCHAPMPANLRITKDAIASYEVEPTPNGDVMVLKGIALLDDFDTHCASCMEEIPYNDAWDGIGDTLREPSVDDGTAYNASVVRSRGFEDGYVSALDRIDLIVRTQHRESQESGANLTPRVEGFLHALEFVQRRIEKSRESVGSSTIDVLRSRHDGFEDGYAKALDRIETLIRDDLEHQQSIGDAVSILHDNVLALIEQVRKNDM